MAQTDTHMPQNGADLLQTSTSAGQASSQGSETGAMYLVAKA